VRINLKVPFAQKDAAKELGARWDAARKIWYVMDPKDPEVFSDWMPQVETAAAASPTGAGVVTGPAQVRALCACAVLPWEHCAHSQTLT
jgi:hypothetical protein